MSKTTALSNVPRKHLERAALAMRRRARNAALDSQRMKQRVMTAVVGTGAAFGMGYLMGKRGAEGASTQISGVDMELVVGGGATILGIGLQGKSGNMRKMGEYLEAAGMGTLAYYAGAKGETMGLESVEQTA